MKVGTNVFLQIPLTSFSLLGIYICFISFITMHLRYFLSYELFYSYICNYIYRLIINFREFKKKIFKNKG